MPMQKPERSIRSHGVSSIKEFYCGLVFKIEHVINIPDLGIFIGNPLIRLNQVVMTALNHEWPGENEIGHLGIAERISHIKIRHLPFQRVHITTLEVRIHYLPGPVSEIT